MYNNKTIEGGIGNTLSYDFYTVKQYDIVLRQLRQFEVVIF